MTVETRRWRVSMLTMCFFVMLSECEESHCMHNEILRCAQHDKEAHCHPKRSEDAGSQLSQQGVDYARQLGATLGPFAQVVASVVPRARETAIAMGFAVDAELVTLATDEDVYAEAGAARAWESPQPFAAIAQTVAMQGGVWRYGHAIVALWHDILNTLPPGAAALMIGHSGELEIALVACFPNADHASWGGLFGPCEGARLVFDGDPEHFTTVEILRGW